MKQQNQHIAPQSEEEVKKQQKGSQHHQAYLNYFKDINEELLSRNCLIELLQSHANIKYTDCNEDQYFKISVFNYTSTFQIINLQVQYGPYLIPVIIYNVLESSQVHYLQTISSSVANIYAYHQADKQQAIKCFPIKKDSFEESFIGALKQYCIFKIAATLNIGPNLSQLCGFDLIVFSQCIEFCMEKGLSLKSIDKIQNGKQKFMSLKRNLRIMHQLNIVHMDIKPTNICFHQKDGLLKFIDFGFSNVIYQEIGFKSLVCFFGSLNYCSPEMLNIYNTGQSQLVDLYYNDVYALRKVEAQLFVGEEKDQGGGCSKYELYELSYEEKLTFRIEIKLQQFYKLAKVKYLFFSASPEVKSKATMQIFLGRKKPLIKFTKTLPYSRLLEQFYELLNEHNQDTYNEDVLKSTLQNYISLKQNEDEIEMTSPQLLQRYCATFKGIHIKRRDIMNVNLNYTKQIGLKQMVSSPQIARDLKKSVYFEKYVLFVNFKVATSSFEQKIDASKVMCHVLGITPKKSQFFNMEISYLITCLRFLVQFYLEEDERGCKRFLPIVLGNLVILEQLSQTEIVAIISKIFNKKLSITVYTSISIKLFLSLYWIIEQSSSRYRMRSLVAICSSTIQRHLREIKAQSDCERVHIQGIKYFLSLDYGTVTLTQLQIFHAFVQQKIPFLDKQMKRQIMLFIQTLTMKQYFNGENSQKIINCIKLISEEDNILKTPHFDYYHFKIFYFFFYTHNIRAMESIIKKLQICLGAPALISKYYIVDLYFSQNFIERNRNNASFYLEVIRFLQEDPMDLKKRALFKAFHLYRLGKRDYNRLQIGSKALISNIHALLRKTFPLEGLLDFSRIYNWYGGYVKNFGQWCYNYVNIITSIYPCDEYTLKCLKSFEDQLRELPKNMSCQCCRQRFESCLIIITAHRLQLEGQYQQIIKIYKQYAYKDTMLNLNHFKLLSILDILRFTIKVPALNHRIEESVLLFCEWMTTKDAWFQSFNIIAKSTQAFQVTNRYFFMKGDFAEYFQVQQKFIQSILQYPTKEYIISYCSSLVTFFSKFERSQPMVIQQLQLLRVLQKNKNPYFALFASIVLIFCPITDSLLPSKIIHFIYINIPKIITFAKCLTRGHLFYYLAKQSASLFFNNRRYKQQKQRKLLFKIKMYTKSSIHDLSFAQFKINYANSRKRKRNQEQIYNMYQIKLSKYYSFIKQNKQENFNLLNFPYQSPFQNETN